MKRFNSKLLLLTLFFFGTSFLVSAQPAPEQLITLQQCLRKAVDNSPQLRIKLLEQNKLHYGYKEAIGRGLPGINFSGSYDDYVNLPTQLIPGEFFQHPGEMIPVKFGTTYNIAGAIDFNQMIYNQGYYSALRISRLMMEQNELSTESTKINLVFEVAQSYYYAQISSSQIRNLESDLEKLAKTEQIAENQYKNGIIMKVDVDRISVNKLNIQTQIDRLRVTYKQQLNLQRYYMGMDLNTPIIFPDSILPVSPNFQVQANPENHIDFRMIEKQKDLAYAGMKQNQASYYPSVNLIGSINYSNQSNDFEIFGKPAGWYNTSLVGLRVSIPVFNGFQKNYRVSQSRIELAQIQINEDDTRRMLRLQSEDAAGKLNNAITDELRQRENRKVADRVYAISQEQYQKGMIPLTDLLNAGSGLREAQTNHSTALIQMMIAELEYRKANGTLLDILK